LFITDDHTLFHSDHALVQRVAIARAIVNEPAILLADEPTGNLDPTNSWEIMSLLKEANERGTTVLVVTHNQEIVNEMNERVITMKQGVFFKEYCDRNAFLRCFYNMLKIYNNRKE